MKRIGIVTFHRALNMGAVLQATVLVRFLNENDVKAEIIDFVPNNSIPPKNWLGRGVLRTMKHLVHYSKYKTSQEKQKKYDYFRQSEMVLSKQTYYGDAEMQSVNGQYDILISGSDQILNTTLTGNSKSFYLHFDDTAKKISYASSFGRTNISENEIELIHSELPKFDALSVREKSAGEIIEREIGIKPQLVVDPVFLMNASAWGELANQKMKLPEKYIFVYSMEVSDKLEEVAASLRDTMKIPVIVVRGGGKPGRIAGVEDDACGPAEFLRYIKDASYVVTNSFHGLAMSIIFEKNFYCVAHSTKNTRLENLMELIGYRERLVEKDSEISLLGEFVVDGQKGFERISHMIRNSIDYLETALK